VGNFIVPALETGLFSKMEIIDSTVSFEKPSPNEFVLDLDLDIFSKDMEYIDRSVKLDMISACIKKAKLITIALSPFFIDMETALAALRQIFKTAS
jgi:hypothetical protein